MIEVLKKSVTELQSHDAMLPVVTSAPFFHLASIVRWELSH